ncbi:hypothetical protein [Limnohabitans lacus]|uniref:Uncharacterized protein n=1 Tax=Limnohabitans lacus TaxID=3045173 RepID=A0ABT6XAH0_9BURK|nr:hypothetical protein [Limnohabitans sp. HM2-2]MDI9235132.1 hypothetical protein [Limnohabitans sp. HM2-2]
MSISIKFATIPNGCISTEQYLESKIFKETVKNLKKHNLTSEQKLPNLLLGYQILDMKAQVQVLGYEEYFNTNEGDEVLVDFGIKIIAHRYNEIINDLSSDDKAMFLEILSK